MATKRKKNAEKAQPDQLLAAAINATEVAEVIRSNTTPDGVKALCRVSEKRTWLSVLEYVLSRAEGWSAHICQQYFMRGGRLVYGWNFILQTQGDVPTVVERVGALIRQGARVAPKIAGVGPLDSFPLVGHQRVKMSNAVFDPRLPGPSKGGPSHKGAYPVREEQ